MLESVTKNRLSVCGLHAVEERTRALSGHKPEELAVKVMNAREIQSFVGADGAIVRELASPNNSPLTSHSLAEIRHPPGTASVEHYHIEAEEVYYVLEGQGAIRIDGHPRDIGPGDVISIPPGRRHKVWPRGEQDLVMLVTCVPAYSVEDAAFTE